MDEAPQAIDIHTHIMPPKWKSCIAFWRQRLALGETAINLRRLHLLGDHEFRDVTDQCFVPARRISDMDIGRVRRQLLSPIPVLFCYWGSPEATANLPVSRTTSLLNALPNIRDGSLRPVQSRCRCRD